jgi:NIMA (never in mitosis gene a)-related kinase
MSDAFKEAEILKNLNHPCIVKIRDVLRTKSKKLWIVMEYADGGDLDNKIKMQKQSRTFFDENTILGRLH